MGGRQGGDGAGGQVGSALTRRQFMRRLGVGATGLIALPILAACSRGVPTTPTLDLPPTPDIEPITPKPSASPVVREGERLTMLVTSGTSLAADEQLQVLATEWGRENNVTFAIETVGAATVRARLATPQGIEGLDIVQCRDNLPWLSGDLFADLSVEAGALAEAYGGYYDASAMQARVEDVWKAIPFSIAPSAVVYRADWLKAAGAAAFPTTTSELLTVSKALKSRGASLRRGGRALRRRSASALVLAPLVLRRARDRGRWQDDRDQYARDGRRAGVGETVLVRWLPPRRSGLG